MWTFFEIFTNCIGFLFEVVVEDCYSIVCVKYLHVLSYIVLHVIKNAYILFLVQLLRAYYWSVVSFKF